MRRKLFAFLSALSLLLCGAVCALWARSWTASDEASLIRDLPERFSYRLEFISWAGVLQLTAGWLPADSRERRADPNVDPRNLVATTHPTQLAFKRQAYYLPSDDTARANVYRSAHGWDIIVLAVPHWCAAIALGILPAVAIVRRVRPSQAAGEIVPAMRLRPPRHAGAVSRMRGYVGGVNCRWCAMARLALVFVVAVGIVGCSDPVMKLTAYHGQPRAQVVAKLGQPQRDETFPMSKAYGEFRVGLQNTYPLSNAANANVEIEEMTWQDGNYWIALWLHQVNGRWVVLDSCRWHKDVVF